MIRVNWKSPVSHYPEFTKGAVSVTKQYQDPDYHYYCEGVRGHWFVAYTRTGNVITVLDIDGKTWMTDEPPFTWSLEYFADQSRGNVLVAGLGLGIVVHQLVNNQQVESITVVEREKDVIKAIKPLLPKDKRIRIVRDDFYIVMEQDSKFRDTVIWDLGVWNQDDQDDEAIGRHEMLIMPFLHLQKYGDKSKLFRHGLDRDPVGEKLVREDRGYIKIVRELMRAEQ